MTDILVFKSLVTNFSACLVLGCLRNANSAVLVRTRSFSYICFSLLRAVHFPRAFLVVIKGFAPPFWGIVIHFSLESAVRRTVAEFLVQVWPWFLCCGWPAPYMQVSYGYEDI